MTVNWESMTPPVDSPRIRVGEYAESVTETSRSRRPGTADSADIVPNGMSRTERSWVFAGVPKP